VNKSSDDRPPFVVAMEWTSRLTTIALEMALPGLAGYGLDRWLGSDPILLILGVFVGFAIGMQQLLRLAKSSTSARK
jgi:F0F1-type ATP synthase assembly protein I